MQAMEYNDLFVILEGLPEEAVNRLPQKYRDLVPKMMVPDAVSSIDPEVPLEQQVLSDETKNLLATLNLTYWAESADDRREFAEALHKNEMIYQGTPDIPMTEEEYQSLLEIFDDWNDYFGPIPFWAESRGGNY